MKKFYYFSKSKLKFVEIGSFYKKFVFLVVFFAILVAFFLFGSFLVFNEFINPDSEIKTLKKNNAILRDKFDLLLDQYKKLDERITSISSKNQDLRLKANLDPISNDELHFGTGGNIFEPIKIKSIGNLNNYLENIDSYINKISLKVKLEKNNYDEIEKTLKENQKMYDAIPAIKPSAGTMENDFGMRMHPILKVMRMHNGIDIITDVGTKVFAPGAGTVDFVGWRSGYGLTLEIDHGFGYRTLYGHLKEIDVKEGKHIIRGDWLALTGNSGELSSGPHLHYEVRHNGIALDPRNFIYDDVSIFDIVKK